MTVVYSSSIRFVSRSERSKLPQLFTLTRISLYSRKGSTFPTSMSDGVFVRYPELGQRHDEVTLIVNRGWTTHSSWSANKNVQMVSVRFLRPHVTDFLSCLQLLAIGIGPILASRYDAVHIFVFEICINLRKVIGHINVHKKIPI
jgi:hypothetical protein